eukprot:30740_1
MLTRFEDDLLWQDREVRFDVRFKDLQVINGEFKVDSINSVEDTKGNSGERGSLIVTNLRLIWISHRHPKVNLSVGYSCITQTLVRSITSKLSGHTMSLFVMTRFNQ